MENRNKNVKIYLFLFYCACTLWILFARQPNPAGVPFPVYLRAHVNLRPFHTIRLFSRLLVPPVRKFLVRIAIHNLLGNILLFIPLGIFLPTLFAPLRGFLQCLISATLIVTVVELMQLLLMVGTCDIDDLLLTVLGASIGYAFYKVNVWIERRK